ncbi:unnamed protein product [Fusarium venenatum]|uniref:Uncharacterized protein n=1 Tax=Fusarium venenatum TaxID=56646 RepID=A0A2L2TCY3_9HYPO|nr:uncharacterized protein FVRRES_08911 [Fusarium venenatum]CEI68834.1 unnamed protein product [Fusarium venenatum]
MTASAALMASSICLELEASSAITAASTVPGSRFPSISRRREFGSGGWNVAATFDFEKSNGGGLTLDARKEALRGELEAAWKDCKWWESIKLKPPMAVRGIGFYNYGGDNIRYSLCISMRDADKDI